jgi:hypothetical protein
MKCLIGAREREESKNLSSAERFSILSRKITTPTGCCVALMGAGNGHSGGPWKVTNPLILSGNFGESSSICDSGLGMFDGHAANRIFMIENRGILNRIITGRTIRDDSGIGSVHEVHRSSIIRNLTSDGAGIESGGIEQLFQLAERFLGKRFNDHKSYNYE